MSEGIAEVTLELFRAQAEFVKDRSYAVAAVTGVGAGKTYSGAIKALRYLLTNPRALCMVTAPTFPMLRDATLRTINETWPRGVIGEWWAGEMRMVLGNGSEVLFRSTDDPEHLRGPNLAYVWMDEAGLSTLESFRILQGRLRQPGYPHQIVLTTTPRGFNWLYEEFGKEEREGYVLHNWSLRDNPYVSLDFIRRLEESYDAQMRLQEIEGKFVAVGSHAQFDRAWLEVLLGRVRKADYEREEADVRLRLWGPRIDGHQYLLGIDPKGHGRDLGYAKLIDWTAGVVMGEIRSENPGAGALRSACIRLCLERERGYETRYGALCVPETNGVGSEWADVMRDAGCQVYRRPRRPGENTDTQAYRHRPWGWNTDVTTRPMMLGWLQEALRQRRLSTPNADDLHAWGSWDPMESPHLPDIISAVCVGGGAGKLLWGEMGSTVAEAALRQDGLPRLTAGRGGAAPAPFPPGRFG